MTENPLADKRVAIVHKHYPERGGAERVADELARTFDAPVFTAYDDDASAEDVAVHELFGGSWATKLYRRDVPHNWLLRDLHYFVAWERPEQLHEFDVLVQSGTAPAWFVPRDDQVVVRYVHSPPRSPYDLFAAHDGVDVGHVRRWYARAVRALYPHTTSYADAHIANSEVVARRLDQYLGVWDAEVVYPPVDVADYDPRPIDAHEGYYVALSRLAPGKGFPEIIDAFREMPNRELRVVGDGALREELAERASDAPNIRFEGYVSETRKRDLLARAQALVFNAENEDFGMVPMEAFAAGTPVIGVDEGFTRHQVPDGVAGVTFERGVDNLRAAVERFEGMDLAADAATLHAVAQACSRERFREAMRDAVSRAVAAASIDPDLWHSPQVEGRGHHSAERPSFVGGGGVDTRTAADLLADGDGGDGA